LSAGASWRILISMIVGKSKRETHWVLHGDDLFSVNLTSPTHILLWSWLSSESNIRFRNLHN
jgi:hypothetical protein